jgi:hypothetical protein
MVQNKVPFTQVIMNLPAIAHTFLPTFRGLFLNAGHLVSQLPDSKEKSRVWKRNAEGLPWIHCYGFSKNEEDPVKDFHKIVEKSMGAELPDAIVRIVRSVAPQKMMLLASFSLPPSIAFDPNPPGQNNNNNDNNNNDNDNIDDTFDDLGDENFDTNNDGEQEYKKRKRETEEKCEDTELEGDHTKKLKQEE